MSMVTMTTSPFNASAFIQSGTDNTSDVNGHMTCVIDESKYDGVVTIPFKVIILLLNLCLFCAAIYDRKKLKRQSYMFYCIISTLLCNILNLLCSIYWNIDNYFYNDIMDQSGRITGQKVLWILTQSVTVSLIYGISANVTSLAYVCLDSAYYVGKKGPDATETSRKKTISSKAKKAQFLVALSWIVPLIIVAISLGWNCAFDCKCPSDNFENEYCPTDNLCSRMWAPLKVPLLYVTIILWLAQVIFLVTSLIIGIRKYRCVTIIPERTSNDSRNNCDVTENSNQTNSGDGDVKVTLDQSLASTSVPRRKSVLKRKLNSRLKFAIILTALMTFCFGVEITLICIESLHSVSLSGMKATSATAILIFTVAYPVLVWRFVPTLKLSLLVCFGNILKCKQETKEKVVVTTTASSIR